MKEKIRSQLDNYISVKNIIILFTFAVLLFSFFLDSPKNIFDGLYKIITSTGTLISDYFVIGGYGATFFNAGLTMLIATLITTLNKIKFTGSSIACIFLTGGFSMFGKNILNIWPIILGVFIYSKIHKESFSQYNMIAIYGTCLAPLVSELTFSISKDPLLMIALYLSSIIIGYLLPPICLYALKVHQGYVLYNVGFSAGILGMILISILTFFNFEVKSVSIWSNEINIKIVIFIYIIFIMFFLVGFILNNYSIKGYKHLLSHSGRLIADYVIMENLPLTLINMSFLGILFTTYVIITSGGINGPTLGGVLSIVGFAAFGKHIRNTLPILIGVVISTFFTPINLSNPGTMLAALFGTCLAPIAGHFGIVYGVLAGFIHSFVVLRSGFLHSGVNLYNNGFAAGLIAIFLVPTFESFKKRKK